MAISGATCSSSGSINCDPRSSVRRFVGSVRHSPMAVVRHLREQYTPGQTAPVSGVYTVVHHRGHRDDHDVVVISGDEFPACRECKGDVRYTIRQQVAYITHDFDLTAPAELLSRRTLKLA